LLLAKTGSCLNADSLGWQGSLSLARLPF